MVTVLDENVQTELQLIAEPGSLFADVTGDQAPVDDMEPEDPEPKFVDSIQTELELVFTIAHRPEDNKNRHATSREKVESVVHTDAAVLVLAGWGRPVSRRAGIWARRRLYWPCPEHDQIWARHHGQIRIEITPLQKWVDIFIGTTRHLAFDSYIDDHIGWQMDAYGPTDVEPSGNGAGSGVTTNAAMLETLRAIATPELAPALAGLPWAASIMETLLR